MSNPLIPDPRTINSEGDPFGPRLAEMLREKAAMFHDYAASAVMEMAAQFIDAVNEGAVIARVAIAAPEAARPTHIRILSDTYGLFTVGKVYPVLDWEDGCPRVVNDYGQRTISNESKWEPA